MVKSPPNWLIVIFVIGLFSIGITESFASNHSTLVPPIINSVTYNPEQPISDEPFTIVCNIENDFGQFGALEVKVGNDLKHNTGTRPYTLSEGDYTVECSIGRNLDRTIYYTEMFTVIPKINPVWEIDVDITNNSATVTCSQTNPDHNTNYTFDVYIGHFIQSQRSPATFTNLENQDYDAQCRVKLNPTDTSLTTIASQNFTINNPDTDGDGIPDFKDRCPSVVGESRDGCPISVTIIKPLQNQHFPYNTNSITLEVEIDDDPQHIQWNPLNPYWFYDDDETDDIGYGNPFIWNSLHHCLSVNIQYMQIT